MQRRGKAGLASFPCLAFIGASSGSPQVSTASIFALFFYGLVILACLAAARAPGRGRERRQWLVAALVFALLIALRLLDGEQRLRAIFREIVRNTGGYDQRWALQLPLAVAVAGLGVFLVLRFARRWQAAPRGSRRRLVLLAEAGLWGLVPLYLLRLVSLHAVDAVLYAGPLRLNWIIEGILCLMV